MPLYSWQVVISGQTEAPTEESLQKTLVNQVTISANVAGSLKNVRVEIEPTSGLLLGADVRKPH